MNTCEICGNILPHYATRYCSGECIQQAILMLEDGKQIMHSEFAALMRWSQIADERKVPVVS